MENTQQTQQISRQFLDYNGLQTLWSGIKLKFASIATVDDIQASIVVIDKKIAELEKINGEINDSINASLTTIESTLKQLSPLSANSYNKLMELADSARLGSVIYLEHESEGYKAGPYIVTGKGTVAYINTHKGNLDLGEADIETILSDIATLEGEIASIKQGYATIEYVEEAINEIKSTNASKIQIVTELPVNGVEGTIYLVKSNTDANENNQNAVVDYYTEYVCVKHNNIILYEKIGIHYDDINDLLANYVTTGTFEESIAKIGNDIDTAKSEVKTDIQNSITNNTDTNSIGYAMTIPTAVIENLMNA